MVVDDHTLFRESLQVTLAIEGYDVRTVAVPARGTSAAALAPRVLRHRPRLALVDLELGPAGDGAGLVRPLARAGVDVVLLTAVADRGRWGEASRSGARTVVSKDEPLRHCLTVVRRLQEEAA